MRVSLHRCFLLHKKPYRETSLLLEVFSEQHGRVGLVARGAAKKKQLSRDLQAFNPLLIAWSGGGELSNLNAVEPEAGAISLVGDYLFGAYYINELLIRLLHRHDPHTSLFQYYEQALQQLSCSQEMETVLRRFEKNLLDELGYGLILDHEIQTGDAIQSDRNYDYLAGEGPLLVSSELVKPQGIKLRGSTLNFLKNVHVNADKEELMQAKHLMRYVFTPLLGDKPLQSRRIFEVMKKSTGL